MLSNENKINFGILVYCCTLLAAMLEQQESLWKIEPLIDFLKKQQTLQLTNLKQKYVNIHSGWKILFEEKNVLNMILNNYNSNLLWKLMETLQLPQDTVSYCKQKNIVVSNQKNMLQKDIYPKCIIQYLAAVTMRNCMLSNDMTEKPLNSEMKQLLILMINGQYVKEDGIVCSSDDDNEIEESDEDEDDGF